MGHISVTVKQAKGDTGHVVSRDLPVSSITRLKSIVMEPSAKSLPSNIRSFYQAARQAGHQLACAHLSFLNASGRETQATVLMGRREAKILQAQL